MKKLLAIISITVFCSAFAGCMRNPAPSGAVYSREGGKQEQAGPQSGTMGVIDPVEEAKKLASPFMADEPSVELREAKIEKELLRLVNEERESAGVKPLVEEDLISWAARMRAEEIIGDTSHYRPDGTPYYTVFDEAGYAYAGKFHGENLHYMRFKKGLYNENEAAARIFADLKVSPGNYSNMKSESFNNIGIGIFITEEQGYYKLGCVQLFSGK